MVITLVNEEFCRRSGYTKEEVEGKMLVTDFIAPQYLAMVRKYHEMRSVDPGAVPSSYEVKIKVKDGSLRDGILAVDLIPGTAERVASLLDITEVKAMEKSLVESEVRYKAIFETTGTATFIFDAERVIQLANREFCHLAGFPKEEIEGKMKITDLVLPEQLEKLEKFHVRRARGEEDVPESYEIRVKDRDDRVHIGVITISMIPGTELRVASFMDVTEHKQAERQMFRSEKMAALGQLIAGVAHEINNPNNFIFFNMPVLRQYFEAMRPIMEAEAERDPDLKIMNMSCPDFFDDLLKMMDNMQLGASRITEIVKDLKSHVSADEESRTDASVEEILSRVMTLVGKQVQKSVRTLEHDVEPDLPPVFVSVGRIEQVLINFIINASHAADKDDSWIRIRARKSKRRAGFVDILVEDNGGGIGQEHMNKIFEPFFTTKEADEGTGMGLWICHRIVEEHGGFIRVESAAGEWTCFTVSLPSAEVVDRRGGGEEVIR
jgi:PAS domain S-box-containing protein